MESQILVIDDEKIFLRSVKRVLHNCGYQNVTLESNPLQAIKRFEKNKTFDVAMIDVTMPVMDGLTVLEKIKALSPQTECIMETALNQADMAVKCLKKGAFDYLVKPVTKEDLERCLRNAIERKRLIKIFHINKSTHVPNIKNKEAFKPVITQSRKMMRILKEAEIHANSKVPILITGESGTGKEVLANAIHQASSRAKETFIPINMATLTSGLFDGEFFGHAKGAFTGADKNRIGYLEYAKNGTLFLDEIGILPLELQGKLLRVLQSGEYMKIGSSKPQITDIRIIASTNEDLTKLIEKNLFRKDLFYRLNGAWLHLPPLRERKEDIPLLIQTFLKQSKPKKSTCKIDETVIQHLLEHSFPGNIRELKSIILSASNLAQGRSITLAHLPEKMRHPKKECDFNSNTPTGDILTLAESEKQLILKTYECTGRNKTQTARLLGAAINTIRKKLVQYGVN